jgi:hypothetical protein
MPIMKLRSPVAFPVSRQRPPYLFQEAVEIPDQTQYLPIYIPVQSGGFPVLNLVVHAEGRPGDDFYLLVDYKVPGQFEFQITNLGSEQILGSGSQILQVASYRPMMPDFDIIIASMSSAILKKVCVTIYGTAA